MGRKQKEEYINQQENTLVSVDYSRDIVEEGLADASYDKKLTEKHERFIGEYLIDYDGPKAAERAGWHPWSAFAASNHLLNNPVVKAEIKKRQKYIVQKLEITQERIAEELAKLAYSNVQDLFNSDGTLKPIHELPREVAATIKEFKFSNSGLEVKSYDKKVALETLGRYVGMFEKDNNVAIELGFRALLQSLPPEVQEDVKMALLKRIESKKRLS